MPSGWPFYLCRKRIAAQLCSLSFPKLPLKIVIAGGSGLIGRALTANLAQDSHEVIILSRNPHKVSDLPKGARAIAWDGRTLGPWKNELDAADAIVNLAGANLKGERFFPSLWTAKRKLILHDSRIQAASVLVEAVKSAAKKPALFIQASAIGYYGPRGDEALNENMGAGRDYLARLCVEWEASSQAIKDLGIRRIIARTGLALSMELSHGLEPQGGRGVVQTQHVGGHVHDDRAHRRMTLGNTRKQPTQQWAEGLGQQVDGPTLLPQLHDPQPEAHDTGQPQGDLEARLGHVEGRGDHRRPDFVFTLQQPAAHGHKEGHEEEAAPDLVEHRFSSTRSSAEHAQCVEYLHCGAMGQAFFVNVEARTWCTRSRRFLPTRRARRATKKAPGTWLRVVSEVLDPHVGFGKDKDVLLANQVARILAYHVYHCDCR